MKQELLMFLWIKPREMDKERGRRREKEREREREAEGEGEGEGEGEREGEGEGEGERGISTYLLPALLSGVRTAFFVFFLHFCFRLLPPPRFGLV